MSNEPILESENLDALAAFFDLLAQFDAEQAGENGGANPASRSLDANLIREEG